jgi:glycosyltransferase involved in cell wall biosynthesis
VIYNGICFPFNPSTVNEEIARQVSGKFTIGTIARLAEVKRVDRLIDSFAGFSKDKDAMLLIIGDGPLMHPLQKQAAASGITDKIIFAGYKSNARNYLPLMDVVVIPSSGEAFGLAAVEAWDAGKPVIAFSDSGGPAELIAGEDSNNIVDSIESLAGRISYFYENGDTVDASLKRKELASTFNIEVMEKKIFNIYKNIH